MKVRYQYRLFFYFAIVLVIVVAGFSIFIMKRERAHNLKAMQSELISYNSMVYQAIERNVAYDSISFQDKVRITIIDTSGAVLFDNLGVGFDGVIRLVNSLIYRDDSGREG